MFVSYTNFIPVFFPLLGPGEKSAAASFKKPTQLIQKPLTSSISSQKKPSVGKPTSAQKKPKLKKASQKSPSQKLPSVKDLLQKKESSQKTASTKVSSPKKASSVKESSSKASSLKDLVQKNSSLKEHLAVVKKSAKLPEASSPSVKLAPSTPQEASQPKSMSTPSAVAARLILNPAISGLSPVAPLHNRSANNPLLASKEKKKKQRRKSEGFL
jgi:hypothetical protein